MNFRLEGPSHFQGGEAIKKIHPRLMDVDVFLNSLVLNNYLAATVMSVDRAAI